MPTAWSNVSATVDLDIGVGTFRDVLALIDAGAAGANFDNLGVTQAGKTYLTDLGINAIELLPPADSFFKRDWGYDTAHFLAPDSELGFPEGFSIVYRESGFGHARAHRPPEGHPLLSRCGDGVRAARGVPDPQSGRLLHHRSRRRFDRSRFAHFARDGQRQPPQRLRQHACSAMRASSNGYDPISGHANIHLAGAPADVQLHHPLDARLPHRWHPHG